MKIDKNYLLNYKTLNEQGIGSSKNKDNFESPLYNPVNPQPSRVQQQTPQTGTTKPQGGNYTTTFEYNPTVQQRLRLNAGDMSLSAKDRGVPTDQSGQLVGKMEPQNKGSWMNVQRTVFNPNYLRDIAASKSVAPSMVNVSTTYYDRVYRPGQQQN